MLFTLSFHFATVCNRYEPSVANGTVNFDNTSMPYSPDSVITADCLPGFEWDLNSDSQDITCNPGGWSTPSPCLKCKDISSISKILYFNVFTKYNKECVRI